MWVGVWMLLCHVQPIIKCFFLVPAQHWKKKMSNWFPAKLIFGHFNVIILHLYPRPPSPKHLYSDYSCTLSLQTCQDILSTRKTVFSFSQIYKSLHLTRSPTTWLTHHPTTHPVSVIMMSSSKKQQDEWIVIHYIDLFSGFTCLPSSASTA